MSHVNQLSIVKKISESITKNSNGLEVLEIGAHEVNGSVRSFLETNNNYVGLDLISGPGVDIVASGHDFGSTGTYDITIACEVLEHNPYWLETVYNMIRITKPGGLVIITCASTGRVEHGTFRTNPVESPGTSESGWHYYKNISEKVFKNRVNIENHFKSYIIKYVSQSSDLYFVGEKNETPTNQKISSLSGWLASEGKIIFSDTVNEIANSGGHGLFTRVLYFPIYLASRILDEKTFQEFAIPYFKFAHSMSRRIQNIIK
jgi:hypothetical protein